MPRKTGLGRGLDALIPVGEFTPDEPEANLPAGTVLLIPVKDIFPNPRQPRSSFDSTELAELADSIRENGILQPLILTHGDQPGKYILIAGQRRLLASMQAGLETVPAILREASDRERLELALVENVQRADLTPLEAAEAYRQLAQDFNLSHEQIAARVGKKRTTITNTLRLLNLPPIVQEALSEEKITEGHARALLALSTPQAQLAVLQMVIKHELSVRQTEEIVRKYSGQKPEPTPKSSPSPEIVALEERLRQSLGTRVTLNPRRKGGTLVIHYFSDEELNALIERLAGGS